MGLPKQCLLLILRPLYRVPESPIHWYQTYHVHHTKTLEMESSPTDPCFLFKTENDVLIGIVVLQVDDSGVGGTSEVRELEESASKKFQTKPSITISTKSHYLNGVKISCNSNSVYSLSQEVALNVPENVSFSEFASLRAQVAYVAHCTRPDLLAQANILSQVTMETMGEAD
jgi:hypothetical protein